MGTVSSDVHELVTDEHVFFGRPPGFSSEAELLAHLRSTYEKTLSDSDSSLLAGVQLLLSAVKTFFVAESDLEVKLVLV